jgi:CheY-like chemotaxis protein
MGRATSVRKGLWISKGIVNLHHGLLSATSDGEDKGSTFRLELPLLRSNDVLTFPLEDEESKYLDSAIDIPSSGLPLHHVEDQSTVKTVLVVDDSSPSRKVVCRLLQNAGYTCHQANDGQHCLDLFDELTSAGVKIDLVLMDFEMPRLNGPSATEALREKGVMIPIIGVTGNVLPADRNVFIDHGANFVLHKPLEIERLNNTILCLNETTDTGTAICAVQINENERMMAEGQSEKQEDYAD